jgi:hypothetical protein
MVEILVPLAYPARMPDYRDRLSHATAEDVADALAFALGFQGRKRVHKAVSASTTPTHSCQPIVAKSPVEHLELGLCRHEETADRREYTALPGLGSVIGDEVAKGIAVFLDPSLVARDRHFSLCQSSAIDGRSLAEIFQSVSAASTIVIEPKIRVSTQSKSSGKVETADVVVGGKLDFRR